jgi:hypothetical protein
MTVFLPLIIFLSGFRDFILAMEIAGSFTVGLTGLIIVLNFWRARKLGDRAPEFSMGKMRVIGRLLAVMFVLGMGYALYNLL